jgi:hypothetical protein
MDRQERKFLGFRLARETKPCLAGESLCPYVETWFKQDVVSAGKPERVERRDGLGNLLDARAYEYTTQTTYPRKSTLTGEWAYLYDGSGTACGSWPCPNGKRTYTSHQYDSYGNVTQSVSHGDYDASGDETTLARTFQPNTSAYIVDRPTVERRYAGAGTGGSLLAETAITYDAAGNPTAASSWLNTEGRYVTRTTAYDTHGNPTDRWDETSRLMEHIAYDPVYTNLPVSVTNGAGETATTVWDPVCGVPGAQTDPNGQTTATQTDALCRVVRTDGPLGGFQIRSYLDFGNPSAQRVVVEGPSASAEDGTGNDWAAEYFDGLGRTYLTARKGPSVNQTIYAETSFNERGQVAARTAPFYDGETPPDHRLRLRRLRPRRAGDAPGRQLREHELRPPQPDDGRRERQARGAVLRRLRARRRRGALPERPAGDDDLELRPAGAAGGDAGRRGPPVDLGLRLAGPELLEERPGRGHLELRL